MRDEPSDIDREQADLLREEAASRPKSEALASHADAGHKILVVEDDDDIRESVCAILEGEGYCALRASNGLQALDVLKSETRAPCLILLDMMMPVMNGWEFCERLARDPTLPSIPLLVMTAHDRDAKVGAARQLRKPLHLDELLSAIEETCGST